MRGEPEAACQKKLGQVRGELGLPRERSPMAEPEPAADLEDGSEEFFVRLLTEDVKINKQRDTEKVREYAKGLASEDISKADFDQISPEDLKKYNDLAQGQARKIFSQFPVDKFYAKENADPLVFCHFCEDIEEHTYDQVRSRRFEVLRRLHFLDMSRLQE